MAADDDTYPKFYDVEGLPVKRDSATSIPQAYHGAGKWVDYNYPARIGHDGQSVDAAEFNKLCNAADARHAPAAGATS